MNRILDPYLYWAGLTGFRYTAKMSPDPGQAVKLVRIAGMLRNTSSMSDVAKLAGVEFSPWALKANGRFFTATLAEASKRHIASLWRHCDFVLAEPGMRPNVPLPPARAPMQSRCEPSQINPLVSSIVFGIIDGRCGFANERFCEPGDRTTSVIDYLWDQAGEPTDPWTRGGGCTYGREIVGNAITACLKATVAKAPAGTSRTDHERAMYASLEHALPADADWSHGTHVLDTVLTDFAKGTASETPRPGVIYVQLPDKALRDTSAKGLAAYVLDGLHYILARVSRTSHVVVNLSLGSFAGPHNGSSIVELAIDDLVEQQRGRLTVVVAAGNGARILDDGTGGPIACHGRFRLGGRNYSKGLPPKRRFIWQVDRQDTTESFIELWVRGNEESNGRLEVSVSLSLADSTGKPKRPVALSARSGDFGILPRQAGRGEAIAAVINATGRFLSPLGQGGMVLLALGHTTGTGALAMLGNWIVEVTNESPYEADLEVRVERRDVPGELTGFRPQYGFDVDGLPDVSTDTLGTLANGTGTIVVGAAFWDQRLETFQLCPYSSRGDAPGNLKGTAKRAGPDVFGVGDRMACGFLSGSTKTLGGTSMAAAQVTAAIATTFIDRRSKTRSRSGQLKALEKLASISNSEAGKDKSHPRPFLLYDKGRSIGFVLPPFADVHDPLLYAKPKGGGHPFPFRLPRLDE